MNDKGLPIGLQLIGKPFDEVSVLAGGKFLEDSRILMTYFIEGKTDKWEVILGLKFMPKSNRILNFSHPQQIGAEPNSQVELDSGMPGALPVINEYCVDQAI